jgi:hypothetical protein
MGSPAWKQLAVSVAAQLIIAGTERSIIPAVMINVMVRAVRESSI